MADEPAFMRWTPQEWEKLAVHTLPHLAAGRELPAALFRAQRTALPKERRREEDELRRLCHQQSTKRHIEAARRLPPERLAELAPPEPKPRAPRKSLDEGRDYNNGLVRWTTLEKARVAKLVQEWRDQGDARALSRLIIEAQEIVIEPDRRRPITSIHAGSSKGLNDRLMEDGLANQWLLKADAPSAAPADDAPAVATVEGDAAEWLGQLAPPAAASAEAPNVAASAAAAASDASPLRSALAEASRVFGETIMGALDVLLAAHTDALLRHVSARLNEQASQTSTQIAAQIAAQIERGMRQTVHQIVELELGGPVATPAASEPPGAHAAKPAALAPSEPIRVEPSPHERKQLRVDVVGLVGNNITEVRRAFNGNTDLRFVDPDEVNGWAPHRGRHVVCAVKWIPHRVKDKLRAAGVRPINVNGSVGTVIHAIEELHRSHGTVS